MTPTINNQCIICGNQCHPMFQSPADPWCPDCFDLEGQRSIAEDMTSKTVTFMGMSQQARTRPPMYMFKQADWPQHGYTMDTIKGFKKRQAEREAKREANKKERQERKAADHERRLDELRNSKWVTG